MKLLNLTAALFLGGVLQAQNPLPAIHPQPQEVTLSTNRLKALMALPFRHATSG